VPADSSSSSAQDASLLLKGVATMNEAGGEVPLKPRVGSDGAAASFAEPDEETEMLSTAAVCVDVVTDRGQ